MCLQHDLREAGVMPEKLTRVSTRTMADNDAALRQGDLDVMQAFEPFASMAEQHGVGDVLYAASARGPTVYTAFIATRAGVARHHNAFTAMTRAIATIEDWLYANGAEALVEATASYFPDVSKDMLSRSLKRYWDADLWARHPAMSQQGFDRLGRSFLSGGALSRMPVYEECVEQSF
jgi:NitT/TauT family transport system substrate-binding protein